MALLVLVVIIMSRCVDSIGGEKDIEQVKQDDNESHNFIGKGTINVNGNVARDFIQTPRKSVSNTTGVNITNIIDAIAVQATSNNDKESLNETYLDNWRTDMNMSILEEHFQEFINKIRDGSSTTLKQTHFSRAINETTNLYTDKFLATLTYPILNQHVFAQSQRIDGVCGQREYIFLLLDLSAILFHYK